MGQANKRGTLEQRVAMAIERNEQVKHKIHNLPFNHPIRQAYIKTGGHTSIQRFSNRLIMAGLLSVVLTAPSKSKL